MKLIIVLTQVSFIYQEYHQSLLTGSLEFNEKISTLSFTIEKIFSNE